MATRTSSQTGLWSASSTWGGAAAPGDGDIAVIGTAAHVVTIDATVTVGDDVGTAITLVGSLVINAPLTIKTGTSTVAISQQRTSSITGSAVGANTGSITFNPTSGTTPHWDTVNTGAGTPVITLTGNASRKFVVTTSTARSGLRAYFNHTLSATGPTLAWTYCDFTELGGTADATTTRFLSYVGSSASSVTFQNCRFMSNIGKLNFDFSGLNDFTCTIQNCDFRVPRYTSWLNILCGTAKVSGLRQFYYNTFHVAGSNVTIDWWAQDFDFKGNVCSNSKFSADIQDKNTWHHENIVMDDNPGINGQVATSAMSNSIVEENMFYNRCDNPHYIAEGDNGFNFTGTIIRLNIADGDGFLGSDAGDFSLAAKTVTLDRNLLINNAGTLLSCVLAGSIFKVTRNTQIGTSTGGDAGEANGHATCLDRYTSNLIYGVEYGLRQDATFVAQTTFNCDYNGFFGLTTATNVTHPIWGQRSYLGVATAAWWASGSFGQDNKGQHDIYCDPLFKNPNATSQTWYNRIMGSGASFTNIRAEVLKLNGTDSTGADATFNPQFTIANWKAYLRDAFTPQNPLLLNAGDPDDGYPDIGAVAVSVPVRQFTMIPAQRLA